MVASRVLRDCIGFRTSVEPMMLYNVLSQTGSRVWYQESLAAFRLVTVWNKIVDNFCGLFVPEVRSSWFMPRRQSVPKVPAVFRSSA